MAFQILLNLFIAFVWMFLKVSYDPGTFIIGYLMGLGMLFVVRRYFRSRFYLGKVWAAIYLVLLFFKELILSNINVLKIVLQPKLDFQPGIFEYKTILTKDWEITLLSNLITLTPGTLVVDVLENEKEKILYIHAIHVPDAHEAIDGIKNTFEKAIMEVSR
ncbi:Na+/H+ antiporter subunit E [Caldibacillus lycopersici]|uniref:Na+/H+ antiporter subunit E n=1 Tax=Perspicuibacillus lycopersici TaxID=1325689 RepID=A0AAE3LLU4_9BACI|nr:Na+/H+ antiporter subunit E [Perspicuibacillus lycopersici]MCU9612775.1 Na+/H+ antiporter subunit E [Perspicuibacillus lycopersici]